ncbi:MAG: PAS domain S-box protein [Methylobacter sp.]|nr:MAG: PAS domain S-box protein [Methylobacter sp.]
MNQSIEELRILMLEDIPSDAELEEIALREAGLVFTSLRVDTRKGFERALDEFKPNIVLAAYKLPSYKGSEALAYTLSTYPHIPVIMVTGALGDEAAAELLKQGARDYVLKGGLARLAPAIKCALSEERGIRNRKLAEAALSESEDRYRFLFENMLEGYAHCKMVVEHGKPVDFIYLNVNKAFETIAGLKDVTGKKVSELIPGIRESNPELFEIYHRVAMSGQPERFETYVAKLDVWFDITVYSASKGFFVAIFRSLSDRKAVEAKLLSSELRYRRLFESAKDGILILDAETGMIVDVNPFLCEILGYSYEELLGKHIWELGSLKHVVANQDKFLELRQQGYVCYEDLPLKTVQGRSIDVEFVSNVYLVGDSKVIQCNIRDISKRKAAEEQIRKLSLAVEQSPSSIIVTDLDARIEYANSAFLQASGYSLSEVIGRNPCILQSGKTPKATYEELWAHLSRGDIWKGEFINRRKDGSEFIEAVLMSPVRQADGSVTHYLAIKEDITQRRQMEEDLRESEARYRRITEGLTDYQYTVRIENGHAVETIQSPDCVTVTGYTAEEFIANPELWIQMVVPEDRERVIDSVQQILAGHDCPPIDHRIIRKDGVIRWVNDTIILFKDDSGTLLSYDGVIKDITEPKLAEEMVRTLNEELENKVAARTADLELARQAANEANRAKSAFLATMSHEIRTPMNGVIGMVDVLHQSSLNGYQVEMVDLIRESAYSLLGIINDILDFSKIEADKLELESAPMSVADMVEKVCTMLDHLAEKKRVELTLFVDPAIPSEVLGDAGRLHQVLINLLNNAIKFSGGQARSGRVSMRAMLVDDCMDAGGRATQGAVAERSRRIVVEISISDNGIGMDEQTLSGLFTPFTQADVTTTRRFGGTGLGLVIAHHLVELMDGEIGVQSAPGKGSTFTVRLPFVPLSARADADPAESPVAGLSCRVVGDSQGLADDIAAYLAHGGATVERAPNLEAAQEQGRAGLPGLWVWVLDVGGGPPPLDELHAIADTRPEQDIRFVVIGRGQRRKARIEDTNVVSVDGNVLTRWTILNVVAIAARRAQEERAMPLPGKSEAEFQAPSRETALRQGRLILAAEDNETNQKVILRQLALLGFAADVADNGRQALERWRSGDYALLLSDLHMPEMDGYELTTAIRAEEKASRRVPIVALTANALKGEAEHCRSVGMDDYLSKPVQLAQLKAMLEKWLPVAVESGPDLPVIPVDVNVLKVLVGEDPAVINEFLHDFCSSATQIAAELKTAYTAGQATQVGALAHKLKASAQSVGALALGELCADMEQVGKAGQVEALTALLSRFETEMAVVNEYLNSL